MKKYAVLLVVLLVTVVGCAGTGPQVNLGTHGWPVWRNRSATLEPGPDWEYIDFHQEHAAWKFRHKPTGMIGSVIMYPILDADTDVEVRQKVEGVLGTVLSCDDKRIRGQRVFVIHTLTNKHGPEQKGDEIYSVCLVSNGPSARYYVVVSSYAELSEERKGIMDMFVNSFTFK